MHSPNNQLLASTKKQHLLEIHLGCVIATETKLCMQPEKKLSHIKPQ